MKIFILFFLISRSGRRVQCTNIHLFSWTGSRGQSRATTTIRPHKIVDSMNEWWMELNVQQHGVQSEYIFNNIIGMADTKW